MRPLTASRILLLALAALVVGALVAPAAMAKSGSYPRIVSISPKKVGIGDVLTIKGSGFRAGKKQNTVVFRREGKKPVFVKSDLSTKTKIWVTVSPKLADFLITQGATKITTRFQLKILANRLGKFYTRGDRAPLVAFKAIGQTSPDCDKDGIANSLDADDDADGLSDVLETKIGTKTCAADSDKDTVDDRFEYESALDLNIRNLPYPGKKPYPNPLDGTDGKRDYDQDGLRLDEEHQAWVFLGRPAVLNYSDGTQYTGGKVAASGSVDLDGNGYLSDDEKDVDNDSLSNMDEIRGRMTQAWWAAKYDGQNDVLETPYPTMELGGTDFTDTSFVDTDTDGDGITDGADDQDRDGYSNAFEFARPVDWKTTYVSTMHPGTNKLARVQPFNPCKPVYSDYCHRWIPFGYYAPGEDWASPHYENGPLR